MKVDLVKPKVSDLIKGSTIERIFSRCVPFNMNELKCSDGIYVPESFLNVLPIKERREALTLFKKGILVVKLSTPTQFF